MSETRAGGSVNALPAPLNVDRGRGVMPRKGSFIVWAAALVASLPSLPSFASDVCERACLQGLVDPYLAALVAHDPGRLPAGTLAGARAVDAGDFRAVPDRQGQDRSGRSRDQHGAVRHAFSRVGLAG